MYDLGVGMAVLAALAALPCLLLFAASMVLPELEAKKKFAELEEAELQRGGANYHHHQQVQVELI